MPVIHIANTLPRPYLIPYNSTQKDGLAVTRWVQFNPGISVDLSPEIWEVIRNHADVKAMLDERTLIPVRLGADDTNSIAGIEAITDGKIAKILEQAVPIGEVQEKQTNNPILTPEKIIQLQELEDKELLQQTGDNTVNSETTKPSTEKQSKK